MVTGAAGYIGAHVAGILRNQGIPVVGVDNFARSERDGVPAGITFVETSIADVDAMTRLMKTHEIDAVMHFAGLIAVGESVAEPLRYYETNIAGSLALLGAMEAASVGKIVFSSSAAVYGTPDVCPIREDAATRPISPYGYSKLAFERILQDWTTAGPNRGATALRYFNVAGALVDCGPGERHLPETHLIPNVLAAAAGDNDCVTVFGDDYPTPDGTCIRDYIHVEDLATAHIAALGRLEDGSCRAFNLGIGRGYSVQEIIAASERVTGRQIAVKIGPRRAGDPPSLFADGDKARAELHWTPTWTSIDDIVRSAWEARVRQGATHQ